MSDATNPDGYDIRHAHRTLVGSAATTHAALEHAAREVARINAALATAQALFRSALADHLSAVTDDRVEP